MKKEWHRKLNRLVTGDYSRPGWYFVTVCTKERQKLFGEIVDKKMVLNKLGLIIRSKILEIPNHFKGVEVDNFVVMPNHVHMIIKIVGVDDKHGRGLIYQTRKEKKFGDWMGMINHAPTLGHMIRYFKAKVSRGFGMKIWQKSYYDKIVRNKLMLDKVNKYIKDNPKMWDRDRNNLNI